MLCRISADMFVTILNSAVALPYAAVLFLNLRQSVSVLCDVTLPRIIKFVVSTRLQ